MNRFSRILPFFAVIILIFSCDFQTPKAIVIKGSPELRFTATMDITEHLMEMIGEFEDDEDYIYLDCVNTDIVTYAIFQQRIYIDDDFEFTDEDMDLIREGGSDGYVVGSDARQTRPDIMLLSYDVAPIIVSEIEMDDFPEGFSFRNSKTKIFIHGTPIADVLSFKVIIEEEEPAIHRSSNASNLAGLIGTYSGTSIPEGGEDIDWDFDGSGFTVKIEEIYIAEGEVVYDYMLEGQEVFVELVVWLPFDFIADEEAVLDLPEMFPKGKDLFGRDDPEDENPIDSFIKSLKFTMNMNRNPFTNALLNIESGPSLHGNTLFLSQNPIIDNSLEFELSEEKMEEVNQPSNVPFVPKVSLEFPIGGTLFVPRIFKITEVAFTAGINYRIGSSVGDEN